MNGRSSFTWVGISLLLAMTLMPVGHGLAQPRNAPSASDASAVIEAVNSLRIAHGLPAYAVNSILMGTAQAQADYMASLGTSTHTGPGGSTVTERLLAAGYPLAGDLSLGGFRSENVAGYPGMSAADVVQSWTGDSIHLHTMLSADLQEIGAGVTEKEGTYYYVIDCARPTSSGAPQAYTPGAEAAYSAGLNQIIVPVSMSTANAKGEIVHEVQPGQSLWQIAIEYGVKIDEIRKLNQLPTAYVINPGDKLLIKRIGTSTPQPPSPTPTLGSPTATLSEESPAPTEPPVETPTPTLAAPATSPSNAGGAVGAIILAALVAAGLVAWAGRTRPV